MSSFHWQTTLAPKCIINKAYKNNTEEEKNTYEIYWHFHRKILDISHCLIARAYDKFPH